MQLDSNMGLSYDDVLLVPQLGILENRADADISTKISHAVCGLPIISAPMSAVTEVNMAIAMWEAGGLGIIHRDNTIQEQAKLFIKVRNANARAGVALGVNDLEERYFMLNCMGCKIWCIDVAHGHSEKVGRALENLTPQDGHIVIVGNVATAEGARYLVDRGANVVKVGIGPGAACTTRTVTGFGVPQLSAIMEVAEEIGDEASIVADGGIRNSGDIVKALAAGADAVMLGSLLAGAAESPHPGYYWGMASKKINGHHAPEGIEGTVPYTGPVRDTIKSLAWGIRSGISYAGAKDIKGLRENAMFRQVSPLVQMETGTRL